MVSKEHEDPNFQRHNPLHRLPPLQTAQHSGPAQPPPPPGTSLPPSPRQPRAASLRSGPRSGTRRAGRRRRGCASAATTEAIAWSRPPGVEKMPASEQGQRLARSRACSLQCPRARRPLSVRAWPQLPRGEGPHSATPAPIRPRR